MQAEKLQKAIKVNSKKEYKEAQKKEDASRQADKITYVNSPSTLPDSVTASSISSEVTEAAEGTEVAEATETTQASQPDTIDADKRIELASASKGKGLFYRIKKFFSRKK